MYKPLSQETLISVGSCPTDKPSAPPCAHNSKPHKISFDSTYSNFASNKPPICL